MGVGEGMDNFFLGGDHMVFGGNRGGIDCQLTANEEGGSHGF